MKSKVSRAEFARICNVTRPAVGKWIREGRIVLDGELVDVAASAAHLRRFRREGLPAGLAAYLAGQPAGQTPRPSAATSTPTVVIMRRGDLVARLRALDWNHQPTFTDEAMRQRVFQAAQCAGLEAVTSNASDDGHWGGFQLRNKALMKIYGGVCFEVVTAGYGFDLDAWGALHECRQALDHPDDSPEEADDMIETRLDLLPALAYPFGPDHQRPAAR